MIPPLAWRVCHRRAQVPALFCVRVSPSVPQELYTIFCSVHTQERLGLPKFLCASLPACHGLRTPADLPLLAFTGEHVLPSGALKPSASATSAFRSCTSTSGCAVTPAAYRMLCLRFAHLVRRDPSHAPPWTQDSIRVGGYPLPDRDFHPARDAKLSWRDNAGAELRLTGETPGIPHKACAVGRELQWIVRLCYPLIGGWAGNLSPAASDTMVVLPTVHVLPTRYRSPVPA